MKLDYVTVPFELKNASGDGSTFEGWAACFNNVDGYGDIIAPGAFNDGLKSFLNDGFIGGMNHDWDQPIGRPTSAEEQEKGLYVAGEISDTSHGKDCKILLKDGVIKKLSIGFRTTGREYLEDADKVNAYWMKAGYTPSAEDIASAQHGARLLTKIRLYEFSPVTVPANNRADITQVKSDLGSLNFAEQTNRVLGYLEDLIGRAEAVKALRAVKEQDISPLSRIGLKRLADRLDSLIKSVPQDLTGDVLKARIQLHLTAFDENLADLKAG